MGAVEKVFVIGVGDDGIEGLTHAARQILQRAEIIIGTEPMLRLVQGGAAERIDIGADPESATQRIQANPGKQIVVLASGDPLFYGTARYLCDRLGKDRFEVIPHVSSMQLAFARVKESWDEAYLTNLANQSLEQVCEKIRIAAKVGVFTTEQASPSALAKAMLQRKIDYYTVYVCENLGSPDERVTQGDLAEVAGETFGPLNVMILVRKPNLPDRPVERIGRRLFGNPDEMFLQSQPKRGLLTPAEVRAIALAELDLGPQSTVWDVGAGSGSVAIEAAQLAAGGAVYAIEMDPEDYQLITANARRFGVNNLTAVLGKAPEAWDKLPAPDAVFVGGTGREVSRIVEQALARLRPGGRIAANVGSLEGVAAVTDVLRRAVGDASVRMIQISRGVSQMERTRLESFSPSFLIAAVKPGGGS